MRTYQNAGVMFPIASANPLQMAFSVWNGTASLVRQRLEAARHERVVASLPPHLRQDIGELDCHPPLPRPLGETLKSRHQTLESMWLRYL